jgi:hypothetical protein
MAKPMNILPVKSCNIPPPTNVKMSVIIPAILPLELKYLPLKRMGTRSAIMLPQAGLAIAPRTTFIVTKPINHQT